MALMVAVTLPTNLAISLTDTDSQSSRCLASYWIFLNFSGGIKGLPLNYTQEEISTKYETVVTLTPACKGNLEWWVELKKAPLGAPV